MRRDLRRKKKIDNSIILGIVCAILVMISIVLYAVKNFRTKNQELNNKEIGEISQLEEIDLEDASTEFGKKVEESKNELNNINETNKKEDNININTNTNISTNTAKIDNKNIVDKKEGANDDNKVENIEKEKDKEITFKAPVKGEIIRGYATENLVYSETLQEWIVHNGVDIKAEKTTVVSAASSGKILSIKNDPRYGLTVIIDHKNGFKSVYSNLLTAEFVVEGEEVSEGQTIGTVGTTAAFEISDDYHLHFELLQNDEYVDPTIYINFE